MSVKLIPIKQMSTKQEFLEKFEYYLNNNVVEKIISVRSLELLNKAAIAMLVHKQT